jgi:peptide/nickel transport system substrate-binding protein
LRITRKSGAMGLLAVSALVLAGCTNAPADDGETAAAGDGPHGSVTVAETNQFFAFNPMTANGNTDINSKIAIPTHDNFYYVDDQLNIVHNDGFGTYEATSEDPLTVTYTINEGIQWSDGEPIDADDLLLAWAIESGNFNNDEHSFDYAGDTGTIGLTTYELGEDGRSITLTYSEPAADWELAFSVDMPAHVVAQGAGLADGAALLDLLENEAPGSENATSDEMAAVMEFWNTGFDSTTLPDDPSLYLSSGPYIVSDVVEDQSVTMVPNENYKGGHPATLEQLVMKSVGDSTAAVQALQNGEVDIISPQAGADTLSALEALDGVTVRVGDQFAYDHIDLTVNNGGPFDPATYGGDVETASKVRQAFLMTVPRPGILDAIITPLKADAEVLDSQLFVSTQEGYADSAANNGSSAFAEPDIEGAKALLAEAGVTAPEVSVMYADYNPNRVDDYTLIAANATEAGFVMVDDADAEWGSRLGDGSYDATIFGWVSSGVGVSGVPQIFKTGGGGNFNGYSNAEVDALADQLIVELDTAKQIELQQQIDALLWADNYGLPLYQSVGVDAVADRVAGIDGYYAGQDGVWWNYFEWTVND